MSDVLGKILKARDQRSDLRKEISEFRQASLSLNLNIPGFPKSDDKIHSCFRQMLVELKRHLLSHRILIDSLKEHCTVDAAGDFYLVPLLENTYSINEIKQITEKFEETHSLGRLLDVDITNPEGGPVSSGKAKLCYFCNEKPALVCMREQNHSYPDIRQKIDEDIDQYLNQIRKDEVCKSLASNALKSLLHEVALSPKPGLVDRNSNGSHDDMDFSTFIDSASVLSVYFKEIAEYGFSYTNDELKEALPELRRIGLLMEEDMFRETNGINTHKGAIFLLGFSLFVSAYLIAKRSFSYQAFVNLIKSLNGNLVERELGRKLYNGKQTHGEVCFEKYGNKGQGIRGEIQAGLPSVFQYAIPVLESHLLDKKRTDDKILHKSLTHALLALVANNDDSNILYRKGVEVLDGLKQKAKEAFLNFENEKFEILYNDLIHYCEKNHISPGGSADLLAVSYFIFTINKQHA
ncbi:triphosphoribosyl-dephospho-CoA synthase [Marinifilum fragile]|uniref:triphosphoribosyl-dephospho-CoA synthase n=1 Tax=Marinifilum fragile TaxID=570161 RepID=UPI002AAA852F|nr:triphosphoribosyl-dephospho-CoA synthase [Marinifilum fragile]